MNDDVSLKSLETERKRHLSDEMECSRECSFCSLDKDNYFGYDPEIYYNAYYNYRKDRIPNKNFRTYRKRYFYRTSDFDEYYNSAVTDMRLKKINKIKNEF